MGKRNKGVGPKLRFDVFRRDAFTCQYCGRTPPTVILEIDHFLAVADGGKDEIDNLVTSCWDCNRGKGKTRVDAPLPSLAERLAEAKLRAEQVEAYNAFLLAQRSKEEATVEALGVHFYSLCTDAGKAKYVFGPGRAHSIRQFLKHLPAAEIEDAMTLAHARRPCPRSDNENTWRYFCGVCWRKIKGC